MSSSIGKMSASIVTIIVVINLAASALATTTKEFCVERTGLGQSDVDSINFRNENCTVDCIMKQGIIQSYHVKDGTTCWNENKESSYKCILGVCRDLEGQKTAAAAFQDDLYSVEIAVISANVADMDDLPGAGGSDVFVTIEVANDGFPTYKRGELVCYTYVIQDNNKPRWNFKCKPLPMTGETVLKFRALDSDKPFSLNPDKLGQATDNVANLLSKGRTKLRLSSSSSSQYDLSAINKPYFVEVEVTGKKYEQLSE